MLKLVLNYDYKTLVLITVANNYAQAQVQTKDKANKCSEVCDVIVYRVSQKIPKTIENDLHMVNKSKFKRKVFLLLFVNLRGKVIFNVIYRLVSLVENQVIIYWLMRCVIFAHSTHGGGLQTVSIINKVAFDQVGCYLVKKY